MKSVLIFRSAALGDFIMSSPALAEVRRCFPSYYVILLTIQSSDISQRIKVSKYAGDFHKMPWIELAMPHLIDEVITLRSVSDLKGLWMLRQYLQKFEIETSIAMSDVWAPLIGRFKKRFLLRFLLGPIPVLGWWGSSDPFKLKRRDRLMHHVHGPLQFMSEMSPPRKYKDADLVFDLRPGHDSCAWASAWLQANQLFENKKLVAVAPGSIQPHKRWPLDSFKSLLESLMLGYEDLHILVFGTPADKELGDALVAIEPYRIHNLSGITSIPQSAALMRHCQLLVGNDGGAMHLGDAMGCKVISIVPGIEFPDSIEPWHNKGLAIRNPVKCSPCYNFVRCPQGHNRCMTELPVEKVLVNCMSVLDQQ